MQITLFHGDTITSLALTKNRLPTMRATFGTAMRGLFAKTQTIGNASAAAKIAPFNAGTHQSTTV